MRERERASELVLELFESDTTGEDEERKKERKEKNRKKTYNRIVEGIPDHMNYAGYPFRWIRHIDHIPVPINRMSRRTILQEL